MKNTFNIDFMNVSLSDMNSLSFDVLKKMQDVNADLEIARRVVKNDSLAVNFFLEEFSYKITLKTAE